jgi:hypothetical protein
MAAFDPSPTLGAAVATHVVAARCGEVPRFYFHLFNDIVARDEEGIELLNDADAMQRAASCAREMAAQNVREGRLVLDHRIEVTNDDDDIVGIVRFSDVVEIWKSAESR